MRLYSLIKNIKCRVVGSALLEVRGLYHKHHEVQEGGLFFCIEGQNSNGLEYALKAIQLGAVAIVSSREISGANGATQIIVNDVRKVMSLIACNFYGNPAKKLKLIGVTGTNGKTTTTFMLAGLLESLGKKVAIMGTNGVCYNGKKIETGMTTPDPIELQKLFKKISSENIEYVCIEVSAHAIFLNKLEGINFEIIVFTNLSEDHLDYFENMEKYFEAKKKIFQISHAKKALINIDDEFGKRLYQSINMPSFTYAIHSDASYRVYNLNYKNFQQEFCFNNKILKTNFLGEYNIYNLIASISCLDLLNINTINIEKIVLKLRQVDGRFNKIVINKKLFIIDYAHTPDALERVLKLCNNIKNKNKLICVFGCGGNRETQKRSKMGEIASKYADLVVITADNSRFESTAKIIDDIKFGIKNSNYVCIENRSDAIKFAYKNSNSGDIILVAGKGSENYMEINGVKIPYSDIEEIKKLENIND